MSEWDFLWESDTGKVKPIKKKNLALFIDAESVSSNYAPNIMNRVSENGHLAEARYYALQKDDSTRFWKDQARHYGIKPILMCGEPSKNKIDNKIIKDAMHMLKQNKSIDIFCIASRDGDYAPLVSFLREHRKRVIIFAPKNTSQKLKSASSKSIPL